MSGPTPERVEEHRALLTEIVSRRRAELLSGLLAAPADELARAPRIDAIAPPLPSIDQIGSAAVNVAVVPRLGASARTIRAGQRLTPISPADADAFGFGPLATKPTIEIDMGTIGFIYDFARALADFVGPDGSVSSPSQSTEATRASIQRMRYATDWYVAGLPYISLLPLHEASDARKEWATRIAIAGEHFVIAHELGHAVLHAGRPSCAAEEQVAREREADLFALRLILAADAELQDPERARFSFAGVQLFLMIIYLAETYSDGRSEDSLHPDAGARLFDTSMYAPAMGVSLPQLQFAVAHIDGTLKRLTDGVLAHGLAALKTADGATTNFEYWRNAIAGAVLKAMQQEIPGKCVVDFVTSTAMERPAFAAFALADLASGWMKHRSLDTPRYVKTQVLPALPEPLRQAVLRALSKPRPSGA